MKGDGDVMEGVEDKAWKGIERTLLKIPKHEAPAPSLLPVFLSKCGITKIPTKKEIDAESIKLVKDLRTRFRLRDKKKPTCEY